MVPWARRVGAARLMPTRLTSCAAPLRAYSALKMATSTIDAPRPPYSAGQLMPTQPASASPACQARPHSICSARPAPAGGGSTWAASQARTSPAKRCSSSVRARSTGALQVPGLGAPALLERRSQLVLLLGTEAAVHVVTARPHE